jgi:hypothetical protein
VVLRQGGDRATQAFGAFGGGDGVLVRRRVQQLPQFGVAVLLELTAPAELQLRGRHLFPGRVQ